MPDRVAEAEQALIEALSGRIVATCYQYRWRVDFYPGGVTVRGEFAEHIVSMGANPGNAGYIQALQYVSNEMAMKAPAPTPEMINGG